MILSNGFVGLWALAAHQWPRLRSRVLWFCVIAAELTVFVQIVLGVLAQGEGRDAGQFHELYGFSAIFAVGILYAYRQQLEHRLHLLYGLGSLFIMGLGIRALFLDATVG